MIGRPPRQRDQGSRGFSLLELLLTIALVALLLGATVFSFSTLRQGVELDEGASRFETLLRLARAQAANTGRTVQLLIETIGPEEGLEAAPAGADWLRLVWEPEPLERPGEFAPVPRVALDLAGLQELIRVQSVERLGQSVRPAPEAQPTLSAGLVSEGGAEAEDALRTTTVTFFPDGSSDSVEILLVSNDPEDARRVLIRLEGITGFISRRLLETEEPATDSAAAEAVSILGPGEEP